MCLVFEVQNAMKDLDGTIGEDESQVILRLPRSAAHLLGAEAVCKAGIHYARSKQFQISVAVVEGFRDDFNPTMQVGDGGDFVIDQGESFGG